MTYTDTDLELVKETGRTVVDNMAEVQLLLDKFYGRLTGMTETHEWVGNNVSKYCKKVAAEKKDYVEYINGMKEIGQAMMTFSEKTEDEVRRIEKYSDYNR